MSTASLDLQVLLTLFVQIRHAHIHGVIDHATRRWIFAETAGDEEVSCIARALVTVPCPSKILPNVTGSRNSS